MRDGSAQDAQLPVLWQSVSSVLAAVSVRSGWNGKPVVGGEAHEKWTPDLADLCDHCGVTVPVPLFTLGFGPAKVLGLVVSNGKPVARKRRWIYGEI